MPTTNPLRASLRKALGGLVFFLAVWWGGPRSAVAACDIPRGDGKLTLFSYPHHEWLTVDRLYDARGVAPDAAARVAHLMRSPDGAEHPMNTRLLTLIDALQDHFHADVVEIISGFRSPQYNGDLKATGHHVARESLHMQGDAADIHFDEIREATLRDFALRLHCGGVGFYPDLNFVHVDVGDVRTWTENPGARKLVGEAPIVMETDRNMYQSSDTITWSWKSAASAQSVAVEHYDHGAWKIIDTPLASTIHAYSPPSHLYGKFRFALAPSGARERSPVGYSNEWYVKRE